MPVKEPANYFCRIGLDGGSLDGYDHLCEECLSGEETAALLWDAGLHEPGVEVMNK